MNRDITRRFFCILAALVCLIASSVGFALPFTMVPTAGTTLPTTVNPLVPVSAYYTISNNTESQRNNNYAQVPPNVSQVTDNGTYPNTCGSTFNLAIKGHPGNSCTLQLRISGPVNSGDPDPRHHLFACFPGGLACSGTNFPLNVKQASLVSISVTPTTPTIFKGHTQQFTATGIYSDNSTANLTALATWSSNNTAVATISASGLATGVNGGTVGISATLDGVTSNSALLTVSNPLVSIAITPLTATISITATQQYTAIGTFFDGTTQNITTLVAWNSSVPATASISATGLATGLNTGTTIITASMNSITSNPATLTVINALVSIAVTPTTATINVGGTQQFTAEGTFSNSSVVDITTMVTWNSSNTAVATITSGAGGGLATGITAGQTIITATMNSITSNSATLIVAPTIYIMDSTTEGLFSCPVNPDGTLGTCVGPEPSSGAFVAPALISLNPAGTVLYATSTNNSGGAFFCSINANGTVGSCAVTTDGSGLNQTDIATDPADAFAYIATFPSGAPPPGVLSYCPLNGDGSFGTCTQVDNASGSYVGLVVNPADTFLYLTNNYGSISYCSLTAGAVVTCTDSASFPQALNPSGITLNAAGTLAYIANGDDLVYDCTFNPDGSFNVCSSTGGVFGGNPILQVAINSTTNFAYVVDGVSVYICPINGDGSFGVCTASGSLPAGTTPTAIALH